MDLKELGW